MPTPRFRPPASHPPPRERSGLPSQQTASAERFEARAELNARRRAREGRDRPWLANSSATRSCASLSEARQSLVSGAEKRLYSTPVVVHESTNMLERISHPLADSDVPLHVPLDRTARWISYQRSSSSSSSSSSGSSATFNIPLRLKPIGNTTRSSTPSLRSTSSSSFESLRSHDATVAPSVAPAPAAPSVARPATPKAAEPSFLRPTAASLYRSITPPGRGSTLPTSLGARLRAPSSRWEDRAAWAAESPGSMETLLERAGPWQTKPLHRSRIVEDLPEAQETPGKQSLRAVPTSRTRAVRVVAAPSATSSRTSVHDATPSVPLRSCLKKAAPTTTDPTTTTADPAPPKKAVTIVESDNKTRSFEPYRHSFDFHNREGSHGQWLAIRAKQLDLDIYAAQQRYRRRVGAKVEGEVKAAKLRGSQALANIQNKYADAKWACENRWFRAMRHLGV